MKIYKQTAVALLGLSAALIGGGVSAAPVTLTGTYVSYSFDDEKLGLFGIASMVGDNLVFEPNNFSATSGVDLGFTTQTIGVTVSAKAGYYLSAFSLTEGGSYTGVVDVDGMLLVEDNFAPNSNFVSAGLVETLDASGNWSAQTGNVLPLAGWGENGVFNSATLTITNLLVAFGGESSIYKDFVGITVVTAPIPEAETYAMMLAGLGLVGFMVRRARRIG